MYICMFIYAYEREYREASKSYARFFFPRSGYDGKLVCNVFNIIGKTTRPSLSQSPPAGSPPISSLPAIGSPVRWWPESLDKTG